MSEDENISEEFKRIKKEYLEDLPNKLETLKKLVETLKSNLSPDVLAEIRHHIHQIAGNAGTFGLNDLTHLAKAWDLKLTPLVNNFSTQELQLILPEFSSFLEEFERILKKN